MHDTKSVSFEVYPSANGATSFIESKILFASLVLLSFLIAAVFANQGAWFVLPFAGIEMLVLGLALWVCRRKLMYREVIEVNHQDIAISSGYNRLENKHVFQRAWAKVLLCPSRRDAERQSLWVRSHGVQVEIGKYLNDSDKRSLASALDKAVERQATKPCSGHEQT